MEENTSKIFSKGRRENNDEGKKDLLLGKETGQWHVLKLKL